MSRSQFKAIKDNFRWVILSGLTGALLALLISLLFPLEHRSDSQLLVITKGGSGVDAYTAMRSAEKIGENLVNVIETGDFFAKVVSQIEDKEVAEKFQNLSTRKKREVWRESVDANLNYGTGMLTVSAYDTDPKQAKMLNEAMLNVLLNQSGEYIGQEVKFNVVNPPLVSKFPVRPNLVASTVAGFLIAFFGSIIFVYYRENKKRFRFW